MYYTVYKITNKINGKIYVGIHKTTNLNDDYMGSGNLIQLAIKKYGIENFEREYIAIFYNEKDMFQMESAIVNEEFVKNSNTYNIKCGGIYCEKQIIEAGKRGSEALSKKFKTDDEYQKEVIEHLRRVSKLATEKRKEKYPNGTFYGKKHTETTKEKMSNAKKNKYMGKDNPSYGSCWISNFKLNESKKINLNELENYLSSGWIQKRVMNWENYDEYGNRNRIKTCKTCKTKFTTTKLNSFCSDGCKKIARYNAKKTPSVFTGREEELFETYKTEKNIHATLKMMNIHPINHHTTAKKLLKENGLLVEKSGLFFIFENPHFI
jgi:hypothetical protein